ncbi:hypothetical protein, partial [Alcaligenes faecalis]|uniref:hypothetical protein n=1 Tax=Alcaligenes faecalis TaxID=511 RepID=UPI001C0D7D79
APHRDRRKKKKDRKMLNCYPGQLPAITDAQRHGKKLAIFHNTQPAMRCEKPAPKGAGQV